jgi:hypothetical protein
MVRHRMYGAAAGGLALAALLLAVPARAAVVDKLLPNDTEVVLSISVKQILAAPLTQKLPLDKAKQALKEQGEAQDVLKELQFDPFTDLDSITVAGPAGNEPDRGLIVVHGKFDVAKFQAKAKQVAKDMPDTLKIHEIKGSELSLYEVNAPLPGPAGNANGPMYVALLGKDTLVASQGKDYVLDAVDKAAGKKKTELKSKDVAALIDRIPADQSLWLALPGAALAKSPLAGSNDDAKQIIDAIQDASASVAITKDVKAQLSVTAKNADNAKMLGKKIKDGLNTGLGLLLTVAANQEGLEPIIETLKKIKPSVKDKVVTVEVELAGSDIEKAINKKE